MIEARSFIESAREFGFEYYTGVPCSFLTPFINYVISDKALTYISSANEGDALATAAGLAVGGKPAVVMMQNSGLGNAVSPLTSLNWVFRIPVLIISTYRGAPGLADEPQHELMGRITPELFELMDTPWEFFPDNADQIVPVLERAMRHMRNNQRPYALIMKKGTVTAHTLENFPLPEQRRLCHSEVIAHDDGNLPSRQDAIRRIIANTPTDSSMLVASTGYTGRELFAEKDRPNQLYMVGSMGCATALGLGLSLARPERRTLIIDGDGAALMRMGNFATLGTYARDNLIHLLLDNGVHDSTGGQATVADNVDFAAIAEACGYGMSIAGKGPELIDTLLNASEINGPRFGHLKIKPGTLDKLPRPTISPEKVLRRFMRHIGSSFQ